MAVSLRLPEKIKQRVEKLARLHDTTAHAFMVGAIEDRLAAEEARAAFIAEAGRRAAQFRKTGEAIPAEEVFDYLRKTVQGKPAVRPKARKLP
jgi:predicted transcriptional regulator